eukprot:COSAG01_NODE_363_length_18113_cov_45.041690_14_plen_106_part_00
MTDILLRFYVLPGAINSTPAPRNSSCMALPVNSPGRNVDAIRVAMPEIRASAYSPDAGDIETALNGWLAGGSSHALRTTAPYGGPCGQRPPLSGCHIDELMGSND